MEQSTENNIPQTGGEHLIHAYFHSRRGGVYIGGFMKISIIDPNFDSVLEMELDSNGDINVFMGHQDPTHRYDGSGRTVVVKMGDLKAAIAFLEANG